MQTHTPFVGVDAHIDPCSRHNRFYETLRQKRVYPTGGQGRPPLRVRSCSHRCTKICNVVPRGRGRTPPLRKIITYSRFTITSYLNSPFPSSVGFADSFPPRGSLGAQKAPAGGFPQALPFTKTVPCLFCPLCTSHHNPAVSPAPACPARRFRSRNPPWSRGRCR